MAKIDLKWAGQFVRFYEADTERPIEEPVAVAPDSVEMKKVDDDSLTDAF
ncbi:MAG: hypothetical protein J6C90_00555 [Clostridia bacterium]|nr:hypothetical protein [Clostridia bacterium]